MKIEVSATSGDGLRLNSFIVYQPRKPVTSAGSVELADYCVMANYVARSTASTTAQSVGVLSKAATREFVYTGTWGGGVVLNVNNARNGFNVATSTNGATVSYRFFGTGVELSAFATSSTVS